MSGGHSKWATLGVRLYYFLGSSYYIYSWFIAGGSVGLLITAGSYIWGSPVLLTFIVCLLSVALLAAGIVIYFLNLRKRYKGTNPGLKIYSSHTIYRILPENQYEYWRELDVEAAFDGVSHFAHLFGWTGSGEVTATAAAGCRTELAEDVTSTRTKLKINFDRPRRKRERFKFSYTLVMTDPNLKARNFLRTIVNEKIRVLTAEVEFPANECPAKYRNAIFMSSAGEIPVFEEENSINREQHKVTWTIKKPRFDYNYCISW